MRSWRHSEVKGAPHSWQWESRGSGSPDSRSTLWTTENYMPLWKLLLGGPGYASVLSYLQRVKRKKIGKNFEEKGCWKVSSIHQEI